MSLGFECIQDLLELNKPARSIRKRVRHESSNSNEIARIQASQQVSNKLLLEPPKLNAVGEGWTKKKDKIPSTPNATYLIQLGNSFVSLSYLIQIHQLILPGPCPTSQQRGFRRTSGEGWQRQAHIISTQQPQIAECPNSERIKP